MVVEVLRLIHIHRVVLILRPSRRVVQNIFSDAVQFILIADDTFVIIVLPQRCAWCVSDKVDLFCALVFKVGNYSA